MNIHIEIDAPEEDALQIRMALDDLIETMESLEREGVSERCRNIALLVLADAICEAEMPEIH